MPSITPLRQLSLTRSQTWVWAGQQLLPASPMNNMAFAFHLREALEVDLFRQAVQLMVGACDALHTRWHDGAEQPTLAFVAPEIPPLPLEDLSGRPGALQDWLRQATARPFTSAGPLYEMALLKVAEDHFVWFCNQHHLITDGWSYSLQVNYVLQVYAALKTGAPLPAAGFASFADYLAQPPQPAPEARAYWDERARQLPPPPKLFGRGNPERNSHSRRQTVQLTPDQAARLEALCQEPDVRNWSVDLARFTVFATAFFAYLHRISGQASLTIGVPAHNRVSRADKQTPGMFMELFPQSVTIGPDETFATLLQKVKAESLEYLRHAKPGSSTRAMNQTFSSLLNYITRAFTVADGPPLTSEWLHSGHSEPGHHLNLQVYDFDATGRATLCFDVNETVLEPAVQQVVPEQFLEVLETLLADRSLPLHPLCTRVRAPERIPGRTSGIQSFNTTAAYPAEKTVVDLFYESAARAGTQTAVVAAGESLSYAALDQRSNQLANYLLAAGLQPEEPVAICLDRSLEMMIGLLGVMKAGGAYVPVDPEYPALRIRYMLEDVAANWLVTTKAYAEKTGAIHAGKTLLLDADWPQISTAAATAPAYRPGPTDLAYIIHTSGSTGRPKGVMNQHNGPMNRLHWALATFTLDPATDVVLQKTTFCFDVSFWELFWPLLAGVKLVFARPGGHKDDRYLREVIREEAITITHFVPPMLEAFLDQPAELPSLRKIFCSGEALQPHQANRFRALYPEAELHNLYGPTEAGIEVTHWQMPAGSVEKVTIGHPLPNAPLYILADAGSWCPVGVPGELFIGGIPVARGYFGKPELTAERFVRRQVFAGEPPVRLYRTGDLARWLPDGTIDFLGRIDQQVKIRGFRIELGEIEATLLEMPQVARAQVLARDEGAGSYLVAYVVPAGSFATEQARAFLADRLPAHMVPNYYLTLASFPLNSNGKIDRAALPPPLPVAGVDEGAAPAGEFEEILHAVWLDALQLEAVGVTTSFHDLGGHSLSAIRLINRINEAFGLELSANTIFRFPTIRGLAAHLEQVIRQLLEKMNDT